MTTHPATHPAPATPATPVLDTMVLVTSDRTPPWLYGPFTSVADRQEFIAGMRELCFKVQVLTVCSPMPFLEGCRAGPSIGV